METSLLLEDGGRFRVTANTLRIPEPVWPDGHEFDPPVAELLLNDTQGALVFKDKRFLPRRLNAGYALTLVNRMNFGRKKRGLPPLSPPKRMVRAAIHRLGALATPLPWSADEATAYPGDGPERLLMHHLSGECALESTTSAGVVHKLISATAAAKWMERNGYRHGAGNRRGFWVTRGVWPWRKALEQMQGATNEPPPRKRRNR